MPATIPLSRVYQSEKIDRRILEVRTLGARCKTGHRHASFIVSGFSRTRVRCVRRQPGGRSQSKGTMAKADAAAEGATPDKKDGAAGARNAIAGGGCR